MIDGAVVVGLGSMGRRRIRLMRELNPTLEIAGVDMSGQRRDNAAKEFGIPVFESLAEAVSIRRPPTAFVCTSPLSHEPVVMECLSMGLHVFMELNLLGGWYGKAIALAKRKNLKLFISSTFLYRREVDFIRKNVSGRRVNYIYHSGQYLPDWHPWESYKDYFVSRKETNACREILAIELPWLLETFGEIETVSVMKGKNSSLDIDFNDNYMISMRHTNGNKGVFCQDVITRKPMRRLEVYSEDLHLFWDGTPQSLFRYDFQEKALKQVLLYDSIEHKEGYSDQIVENAYRDEISDFFAYVEGLDAPRSRHSLEKDGNILALVDKIEEGVYG